MAEATEYALSKDQPALVERVWEMAVLTKTLKHEGFFINYRRMDLKLRLKMPSRSQARDQQTALARGN